MVADFGVSHFRCVSTLLCECFGGVQVLGKEHNAYRTLINTMGKKYTVILLKRKHALKYNLLSFISGKNMIIFLYRKMKFS
jgi:hypothetical protein